MTSVASTLETVVRDVATSALSSLTEKATQAAKEEFDDTSIWEMAGAFTDSLDDDSSDSPSEEVYTNAGKLIGAVAGGPVGSFLGGIAGKILHSTVGKTMEKASDALFGWIPGYDQIKEAGQGFMGGVLGVAASATTSGMSNADGLLENILE